ncbi:hypothetical protein [Methylobacterium frigidaeris]|nr:hypothetical protein [Methylobacterium frigidaeris]
MQGLRIPRSRVLATLVTLATGQKNFVQHLGTPFPAAGLSSLQRDLTSRAVQQTFGHGSIVWLWNGDVETFGQARAYDLRRVAVPTRLTETRLDFDEAA